MEKAAFAALMSDGHMRREELGCSQSKRPRGQLSVGEDPGMRELPLAPSSASGAWWALQAHAGGPRSSHL